MKITSAVFKRGIRGAEDMLSDDLPQIAFIGRSNAGKSSLINSLTGVKNLARTSGTPGRTQELNVFLLNNFIYLIDFPGYGFAKTSLDDLRKMNKLIHWYLFEIDFQGRVVLIIDAEIGPTKDDLGILKFLEDNGKDILIVANKVDKIKKSQYLNQLKKIREQMVGHKVMPYSSTKKIGIGELSDELLGRR
ncbi:MAG: ribosome biogenesis GTP-binding protein YihA/YsxC [bacterium]|nr:ribosome biogenesis GTP-binding protein YihA/YsxC [bacterium]